MARGMKPESATYQCKIKGILPNTWTEWFDWFEIKHELGRQRLITGDVIDQTQLPSLLERIRDLGLTFLKVKNLGTQSTHGKRNT